MTGSIRGRLLAPALALALIGMLTVPGGAVAAGQSAEPYAPFVTDFGGTPTAPAPAPTEPSAPAAGLDWGDVAIGAATGFGAAVLLAAAGVAVRARRGDSWLPSRNEAGRVAP